MGRCVMACLVPDVNKCLAPANRVVNIQALYKAEIFMTID
jgi:hypothetical protein